VSATRFASDDRPIDRFEELLIGRALGDLDHREQIELEALLASDPSLNSDVYDLTAAACDLALDGSEKAMPEPLRQRIEADAEFFYGARAAFGRPAPSRRRSAAPVRPGAWQAMASAAVVLLVIGIAWTMRPSVRPAQVIEPAFLREEILASGDFVQWNWVGTEDPTVGAVSGDVVWSLGQNTGTMRIGGLAANDPSQFQYQLWIFDQERDERFPVDGGVFDIPAEGGEVIVPISAKLPVGRPYLFAVTVERPGGVVVSGRERIAILAQPPTEG
jgi:anti-sigma-K factor RskA